MKELENCLKKLDRGVSRKRRNWVTQQKPEVNNLELRSQLGRTWEKISRLMMQYVTRDDSGVSLAIRKDATCFLRWIMSVIPDAVIQV